MKKLVYLLVVCLCVSGLPVAALSWTRPALAETQTEAKAEKKSKKSKKAQAEDAGQSESKKSKESEKSKKEKKASESAEPVYSYDLNKNGEVKLSKLIKEFKLELSLGSVKGIEAVSKNAKKYVAWEQDKKDYVLTVVKGFKELDLRVKTKKGNFILRLKNGTVAEETEVLKEEATQPAEATKTESKPAPEEAPTEQQPPEERAAEEAQKAQRDAPSEGGEAEAPEGEPGKTDKEQETAGQREEAKDQAEEEKAEELGADKPEKAGEAGGNSGKETEQTEVEDAGEEEKESGDGKEESAEETEESGKDEGESEGSGDEAEESGDETEQTGEESEEPGEDTGDEEGDPEEETEEPGDEEGDPEEEAEEPGDEEGDPEEETEDPGDEEGDPEEETEEPGEGTEGEPTDPEDTEEEPKAQPIDIGTGDDALPEDAEAWFERDGVKLGGTLKETLDLLEGGETVYIRTRSILFIQDAPAELLAKVILLPDEEAFKGKYAVRLSQDSPAGVEQPTLLDEEGLKALGAKADLYLWVGKASDAAPEDPVDPEEPRLTVETTGYAEDTWCSTPPRFDLSGIPEGKNWSYAAIIYDERFVPISGSIFVPTEEGTYTLRFAMLDEYGDILSASDQYVLWLDWTAPTEVSIETDEEDPLRMYIRAEDSYSGVSAISLDEGKTWEKLGDGELYTYTATKKTTFDVGVIQIRDAAGNIYFSDDVITLEPSDEGGGGGFGGGGGSSGGEAKPVLSHASGDGEEGVEYDALTLEIPDEPMDRLSLGGEVMDLTLLLGSAQANEAPVGESQYFTASLRRWGDRGEEEPDTLLLSAELDANLGDEFSYDWRFNGEVYRMLANSGIKYVALQVGDDVAAFPTEGFTGGTKYTELKMLGVSTRRFDYTLTMRVNLDPGHVSTMSDSDFSQECDLSIRTEVENMNYELSSSPKSIMYFYDVYLGPEDMLDQPFGAYNGH